MSAPPLRQLERPGAPELNVARFFKQVNDELGPLHHAVLEHLVDAGTTRGWFPGLAQLQDRFTEHWPADEVRAGLALLVATRTIELDATGAIVAVVSGITSRRTGIQAAADGSTFSLRSALDALTIAGTLQKPVVVTATCPETQTPVRLVFDASGSLNTLTPVGAAAYIPGWDGRSPLGESLAVGGFFTSDAALEAWQAKHPEANGLPLGGDTLRFIGPEMAAPLAELYVHMSVR